MNLTINTIHNILNDVVLIIYLFRLTYKGNDSIMCDLFSRKPHNFSRIPPDSRLHGAHPTHEGLRDIAQPAVPLRRQERAGAPAEGARRPTLPGQGS